MVYPIRERNINQNIIRKIGGKDHMKLKAALVLVLLFAWISGCKQPVAYGTADKTPYSIKTCLAELSKGGEIDSSILVDRIVVYK